MLLTFGLLSPNKGIETVIRALPAVLKGSFPTSSTSWSGPPIPWSRRRHGEAYRTMLEREAERLGVRDHVVFRDQYVTAEDLRGYLQATDIFISPYLNEAQVTSGALSYAMGAGTAVVSTPYWHAQELLANERGCLFPFGDSQALSHPERPARLPRAPRAGEVREPSSIRGRWTGRMSAELISSSQSRRLKEAPSRLPRRRLVRASSLPDLRLDHLLRMTDDTGIIQHATYSVPLRRSGYCVDDNARALIVALLADRVSAPTTRRLVTTYLGYLQHAQRDDGTSTTSWRTAASASRTLLR